MQDSFGMKDFFVREIQGEWMKIQECIDYGPLYAEDAIVDEEGWEKISKLSEKNPIYWIRWRKGDKILTPQTEFYSSTAAKHSEKSSSPHTNHKGRLPHTLITRRGSLPYLAPSSQHHPYDNEVELFP